MLGLKRGGLTRSPCHMCLIEKGILHLSTFFPQRNSDSIITLMDKSISRGLTQKEIEATFAEELMLSVVPVSSKLLLMSI